MEWQLIPVRGMTKRKAPSGATLVFRKLNGKLGALVRIYSDIAKELPNWEIGTGVAVLTTTIEGQTVVALAPGAGPGPMIRRAGVKRDPDALALVLPCSVLNGHAEPSGPWPLDPKHTTIEFLGKTFEALIFTLPTATIAKRSARR